MKKYFFSTALLVVFTAVCFAQNVGIGNINPLMKLHVSSTDSAVALLENTTGLTAGVSNALYFKTGSGSYPYTGAVKTIGESPSTARLGLFSYTSTSPNQLLERLSVADNGYIGIGTINPLMKLHIAKNDSALAIFENTQTLNVNVSNALYFKTGNGLLSYTGAVKTIGEGTGAARLGLFTYTAFAANGLVERLSITDDGKVGIGNIKPQAKFHVTNTDSAVAIFENTQTLNTNVSTALYFKTGTGAQPYTGAIKTIGEATNIARLGLFTFTSTSGNSLKERMSITDAGNIGMGTTTPQTALHINPNGAGALLIGTNRASGGYTALEMGITSQTNGYGYIQAIKLSGSTYGNLAINQYGGNVAIGTSALSANTKLTVAQAGGNYSGLTVNANGPTANLLIPQFAIKATGTNGADALIIDGAIRVKNTEQRVVYQMTTQKNNANADGYLYDNFTGTPGEPDGIVSIRIENPLCNADPTAIIIYSFIGFYQNNKNYQSYTTYDFAAQRWFVQYKYDTYLGSPSNTYAPALNIMIIKQ